jgi:hypothetical protein
MYRVTVWATAMILAAALGVQAADFATIDECMKIAKDTKAVKAQRIEALKALAAMPERGKVALEVIPLINDGELLPHAAVALTGTDVVEQTVRQMADAGARNADTLFNRLIYARVPGAFEAAVQRLSDPQYIVRKRALTALAGIRGFHEMNHSMIIPALPALADCAASDLNILMRLDAVGVIGSFRKTAATAVPALAARLGEDADMEVRQAAAQALGQIGQPECVAPLIEALAQGNDDVRYAAALALGAVGKPAVAALEAALASPNSDVQRYAAFAAAKIGADAAPCLPSLLELTAKKDELVRGNAADALGRMGDKGVVPALKALAKDRSLDVRLAASAALKMLGEEVLETTASEPAYASLPKGRPGKDGSGVFFPADKVTLYATHHGEPAGYPGCLPDEKVATKEGEMVPKYPKWGNAQIQLYPGSVEHYRTEENKYLPPWSLFNAATLLKNFRATELSEAKGRIEEYAEPVYWTPMYGQSSDTGRRNPPVKVVRARMGDAPFTLELGKLDVGLYVVRMIGIVPGNPTGYRQPLYVECRINDEPGRPEAMTRYRLRVGYVDEFYSLAEFYFYAHETRAYRAVFSVGERSEVEPLVYNFDLHDAWHGCALRPIKTHTTPAAVEEREAKRAQYRRQVEKKERVTYACGAFGYWQPQPLPLPPEERLRRDRALWGSAPPINRNTGPGYSDQPIADDDGWRDAGGFLDRPMLRNDTLGLRYTYADLLNFHALPDPYPNKDDGGAVFVAPDKDAKYPRTFLPIARMLAERLGGYSRALNGLAAHHPGVADVYAETGDEGAGRDAAMMLVRAAYLMPTEDGGRQQVTMAIAGNTTDLQWGGKDHWTRRRLNRQNRSSAAISFVGSYDKLYDYIRGNQEFARAVNRFIPWVKTPEDVIAFIDCSYQHYIKRCMYWHYDTYGGMSESVIAAAIELGDWQFTKPWMDWVFRETWKYPNARAGLPDYATTSTSRDGTSYIGSWSYAQDRPSYDYAKMTGAYIHAGGMKEFDLSDAQRYPKALAGCYFDFEGRAAGLHYLGIGDVGGPSVAHGQWFGDNGPRMRTGWAWSKDPKFAWALVNYYGRKTEGDAEWKAIEEAAATCGNPWFRQSSRVLTSWAGLLESGTEHDDFRFRRAAMVRLGSGWGHQHDDTLDLILWCHGVIHAAEGGERPEKRSQDEVKGPADQKSYVHNVVEVDGMGSHGSGNWRGHSWAAAMKDTAGARYLDAVAAPGLQHPYVSLFRRQVALVDVDEGRPANNQPGSFKDMLGKLDVDVVTPDAYIFDVFRVSGGRRHTYCFHGPSADRFQSNAVGVKEVPWGKQDTPEGLYLKNFPCPDNRTCGTAPAILDATWRLRRETSDIRAMLPVKGDDGTTTMQPKAVFKTGNAEQGILQQNYDPNSPPKFTRLMLFGQEGARVVTGRWIASAPAIAFDCLYTQRDLPGELAEGEKGNLQSRFPAIIEMYAGQPVVLEGKLLGAMPNEEDALGAAAVELRLRGDRTDVCFADGRPDRERSLDNGMGASGEFAYFSIDRAGVRQATLLGGTKLGGPSVNFSTSARERRAAITRIDYAARKVWIDQPWPALLNGQNVEIGAGAHRTTYTIASVAPADGGAVLILDKGMDYYASLIKDVDEAKGEVLCGLALPMDDGAVYPGLSEELVISNAGGTKFWRGTYLGGTREDGYRFKLNGAMTKADFPGNKLRVWEIGVGDTLRVPTHVSLRRIGEGRYELSADTAVRMKLLSSRMRLSSDGKTWKDAPGDGRWVTLSENDLGKGVVYLEAAK